MVTLVASCFLGALPPVDLRAVCLVRAMESERESLIRFSESEESVMRVVEEKRVYICEG